MQGSACALQWSLETLAVHKHICYIHVACGAKLQFTSISDAYSSLAFGWQQPCGLLHCLSAWLRQCSRRLLKSLCLTFAFSKFSSCCHGSIFVICCARRLLTCRLHLFCSAPFVNAVAGTGLVGFICFVQHPLSMRWQGRRFVSCLYDALDLTVMLATCFNITESPAETYQLITAHQGV